MIPFWSRKAAIEDYVIDVLSNPDSSQLKINDAMNKMANSPKQLNILKKGRILKLIQDRVATEEISPPRKNFWSLFGYGPGSVGAVDVETTVKVAKKCLGLNKASTQGINAEDSNKNTILDAVDKLVEEIKPPDTSSKRILLPFVIRKAALFQRNQWQGNVSSQQVQNLKETKDFCSLTEKDFQYVDSMKETVADILKCIKKSQLDQVFHENEIESQTIKEIFQKVKTPQVRVEGSKDDTKDPIEKSISVLENRSSTPREIADALKRLDQEPIVNILVEKQARIVRALIKVRKPSLPEPSSGMETWRHSKWGRFRNTYLRKSSFEFIWQRREKRLMGKFYNKKSASLLESTTKDSSDNHYSLSHTENLLNQIKHAKWLNPSNVPNLVKQLGEQDLYTLLFLDQGELEKVFGANSTTLTNIREIQVPEMRSLSLSDILNRRSNSWDKDHPYAVVVEFQEQGNQEVKQFCLGYFSDKKSAEFLLSKYSCNFESFDLEIQECEADYDYIVLDVNNEKYKIVETVNNSSDLLIIPQQQATYTLPVDLQNNVLFFLKTVDPISVRSESWDNKHRYGLIIEISKEPGFVQCCLGYFTSKKKAEEFLNRKKAQISEPLQCKIKDYKSQPVGDQVYKVLDIDQATEPLKSFIEKEEVKESIFESVHQEWSESYPWQLIVDVEIDGRIEKASLGYFATSDKDIAQKQLDNWCKKTSQIVGARLVKIGREVDRENIPKFIVKTPKEFTKFSVIEELSKYAVPNKDGGFKEIDVAKEMIELWQARTNFTLVDEGNQIKLPNGLLQDYIDRRNEINICGVSFLPSPGYEDNKEKYEEMKQAILGKCKDINLNFLFSMMCQGGVKVAASVVSYFQNLIQSAHQIDERRVKSSPPSIKGYFNDENFVIEYTCLVQDERKKEDQDNSSWVSYGEVVFTRKVAISIEELKVVREEVVENNEVQFQNLPSDIIATDSWGEYKPITRFPSDPFDCKETKEVSVYNLPMGIDKNNLTLYERIDVAKSVKKVLATSININDEFDIEFKRGGFLKDSFFDIKQKDQENFTSSIESELKKKGFTSDILLRLMSRDMYFDFSCYMKHLNRKEKIDWSLSKLFRKASFITEDGKDYLCVEHKLALANSSSKGSVYITRTIKIAIEDLKKITLYTDEEGRIYFDNIPEIIATDSWSDYSEDIVTL